MTNYRTDLMDEILTSPEARNIVGQVSPIYGAAFVALWLFQVIGCQLDDMEEWSRAFQAETVPQTATWSLDYWEENYGIPRNPNMTASQRRARIISRMRDRAPMGPAKLARYITDVSGYECEIIENTGKNRFTLIRRDQSGPLGLVRIALNEAKPAHVIYKLNSTWQNEVATREGLSAALQILSWAQTAQQAKQNKIRVRGPAVQTGETGRVFSRWAAMERNADRFRLKGLTVRGAVDNWQANDFSFDGEIWFDGSFLFDQQVKIASLLGLKIRGLAFRNRETAQAASLWPTRLPNRQAAVASLEMGQKARTGEQAMVRGMMKTAVWQRYSLSASLITNKNFAFNGDYAFNGAKQFNANAAIPL